MFVKGQGGVRNWGQGLAFAERACMLDHVATCSHFEQLRAHPPDWHCSGETDCQRLCDEGIGRSCRMLAQLRNGDPATYELGCKAADPTSCTLRGHAAESFVDGAPWYELGCNGGDRTACLYNAFAHAKEGQASARNELRNRCGSDPEACVLLGLAVADTQPDEADRRWREACARHHGAACRLVAEHAKRPADRDRLLSVACKVGDTNACNEGGSFGAPLIARRSDLPAWE